MSISRTRASVLACLVLWVGSATSSLAAIDSLFICGTETPAALFDPGDETIETRILFVAYPGMDTLTLPVYAENIRDELADFFSVMSRGARTLNIQILKRTDDSTLAWLAPHGSLYYANMTEVFGFHLANYDIMTQVDSARWVGVEHVIFVHYQCPFPCDGATDVDSCGAKCWWGGVQEILTSGQSVPGFDGEGVTTRILSTVNSVFTRESAKSIAAHETGHRWNFVHTRITDGRETDSLFTNPGRYDIMRAGSRFVGEGLRPINPLQYHSLYTPEWVPRVVLATDTLGLRVPDVLGDSARTFEVAIDNDRSFVFWNFQQSSPYDAKYGRKGLHIWQIISWPRLQWKLQSASGLFDDNWEEDPIAGKDSLTRIPTHPGSPFDIYDGVNATDFAYATNPSSRVRVAARPYVGPFSVPTSIAFENIHRDSPTGDMIVDVYVTPMQRVLYPNGGEAVNGNPVDITWDVRDLAGITSVDVALSPDGGENYVMLASALSNTGSYSWTPDSAGTEYRVKVTSHDEAGGVGVDISDSEFSVDLTRPDEITDLDGPFISQTQVILTWTASGDDSIAGQATEYDLRFSGAAIDSSNFYNAPRWTMNMPSPGRCDPSMRHRRHLWKGTVWM